MPRVNVYLPDELAVTLRARLPDLNLSQLVQDAIRGVLGCKHHDLICSVCAEPVDRWALVDERMGRFYGDLMWALAELVNHAGTAEGAARVLKEVATRYQVSKAGQIPLPRPSRAEREAAKVAALPTEAGSRGRHPTARAASPANPQATVPAAQEDIA